MFSDIQQLYAISRKKERRILGLMSGTSLDGLDLALCRFSGSGSKTNVVVEAYSTVPYGAAEQESIRAVFAKPVVDFQQLTLLHAQMARRHAQIILDTLNNWNARPEQVDIIASHGQTVFHAPQRMHQLVEQPNATMQIVDGDHLARLTGIITLSDFRQKHIAAGGEGAPLALYGDYFLFSKKGINRVLLNIGGIANFTVLPADGIPDKVMATDTGPGNTLIDHLARTLFHQPMDTGGALARFGVVIPLLLDLLLTHPFFKSPFPKTTGPEMFSADWLKAQIAQLPKGMNNPYDLIATVTQCTIDTVAAAIRQLDLSFGKTELYISGGGAHNPVVVEGLRNTLPGMAIKPFESLGIPGDAKESVLFAVLANESIAGKPYNRLTLGKAPMVGMGKISFPG